MFTSMTNSEYAQSWEKESLSYVEKGLYEKFFELLPEGKVLEIGCGCGYSTAELLKRHEVLSLECNPFMINKASEILKDKKNCIHKCDVLKLQKRDKDIIRNFAPDIIVGCCIGANGLEVLKHVKDNVDLNVKPKLYREKIEDFIISDSDYFSNVSTILLVNRGAKRLTAVSDEKLKEDIKKDYEDYVFTKNGYKVKDISFFDWPIEKTQIPYSTIETVADAKEYRATTILASKES